MLRLNTILVPTDCSDHSRISVRYATKLATEFDANITLLYVEEHSDQSEAKTFANHSGSDTNVDGQKKLKNFLISLKLEKDFFKLVALDGDVVSEIINFSKEVGSDIIVMSSHGYKGLAYSMKGSTTEKVTRYASCPVLCVKNEGRHLFDVSE